MKTRTALFLGLTGLTVAGILCARRYYRGLSLLEYGLIGVALREGQWMVQIGVYNPTGNTYPVPMLMFNVYDDARNHYGTMYSNRPQFVYPGWTMLDAYLLPTHAALIAPIASLILGESILLTFQGSITLAGLSVPLQFSSEQKMILP